LVRPSVPISYPARNEINIVHQRDGYRVASSEFGNSKSSRVHAYPYPTQYCIVKNTIPRVLFTRIPDHDIVQVRYTRTEHIWTHLPIGIKIPTLSFRNHACWLIHSAISADWNQPSQTLDTRMIVEYNNLSIDCHTVLMYVTD